MGEFAHTIASLGAALKGMPHTAPLYVRLPDGSIARVRYVRPIYVTADEREVPSEGRAGQVYAISLELE